MLPAGNSASGVTAGGLFRSLFALWFAGVAMRMTILVMPPVIPLVHAELQMSETQVGLLIGLPLAIFALAAVPGSLLAARVGASLAVVIGMTITAFAGAARGLAVDVATLYAAAIATGFGVALMQPAMPALVHEWLPARVALGTVCYSAGMLMGAALAPVLTIPFVLPLAGSWRLDLIYWGVPALALVPIFYLLSPKIAEHHEAVSAVGRLWWPDFKSPLIWLLGLCLGSNNSAYFTTNAFLGDYLSSFGRADLLGPALAWLNGAQMLALLILFPLAHKLQRRAWPYLIFGPMLLAAFLGMIFLSSGFGISVAATMVGFTTAITLPTTLALPPLLSSPGDVHRTAAGMFTISYSCAIAIPTISGALWDLTGRPWTAFVPLCVSAVTLTLFGLILSRRRPVGWKPAV
jgi:MFS transporter, CP family, cyanate transporter